MNSKRLVILLGVLVLALLLTGCGAPAEEAVEPAPVDVVEEEPASEPEPVEVIESSLDDYLTLSELAAGIRGGSIDAGEVYGMGVDERFHNIHAKIVGLACVQCHVQEASEEVTEVPEGSPGVADRRVCLGCHLNGPAVLLYEPKE